MDSWRSLQEVLPRFFQGFPRRSSKASPRLSSRFPEAFPSPRLVCQGVPRLPRRCPKAFPGSRLITQGVPKASQQSPKAFPGSRLVPQAFPTASQEIPEDVTGILVDRSACPQGFPADPPRFLGSRFTYQERPSRITYQARPSSCLRPLGLFQFGASVELSRHVLSFKTIYSNVPPRCSS